MIAFFLLLLFVVLPIAELALLIRIGQAIDWPATIAIVLLTGVIGSALARWQGLKVVREIQTKLAAGELPGRALFDGALILFAGAVLITPGVITDLLGFMLLLPPVRSLLASQLQGFALGRFKVQVGGLGGGLGGLGEPGGLGGERPPHAEGHGEVIDVTPRDSRPAAAGPAPGPELRLPPPSDAPRK